MSDPHETPSPPPPGQAGGEPSEQQTPLPGPNPAEATRPRTSVWFASLGLETGGASRNSGTPTDPAAPPEPAPDPESGQLVGDRFELRRKVGQGGMAVVFAAMDRLLDRKVAVKVVRHDSRVRPEARREVYADLARRFAQEARITCQLQHPGIPPVHEVGALPDGRPFMVMKLIKGNTLSEMLKSRYETAAAGGPAPLGIASDLSEYLQHFEKVCQTVEYAHSKGVVHRDLDPRNVMVGAFGEVQVMDWGLATVLAGVVDRGTQLDDDAVDATVIDPGQTAGMDQSDGAVGKFWYMPPEQAVGERVDRRSDVFALGAILCEILTGQPPYTGRTVPEARREALLWLTEPAFARLDRCGADADLVALVKRCLARRQEERPADAAGVAQEVGNYRAGVASRLRQAELDRHTAEARADAEAQAKLAAEAKAQAEGEAKREALEKAEAQERARVAAVAAAEHQKSRRRMQLGFVGTAAALVLVVIAGLWWNDRREYKLRQAEAEREQKEAERERQEAQRKADAREAAAHEVTAALIDSRARLDQTARLDGEPERWAEALGLAAAAADRAQDGLRVLTGTDADVQLLQDVRAVFAEIRDARSDHTLVGQLDEIALSEIADFSVVRLSQRDQMRARYRDAFKGYGLDAAGESAALDQCGDRIRKSRHRVIILVALFEWQDLLAAKDPTRRRLDAVINRALEPGTMLARWRDAPDDPRQADALLLELTRAARHPREIEYLATQLRARGQEEAAVELLRQAIEQNPRNVRLRLRFARFAEFADDISTLSPADVERAVKHADFVVSFYPRSPSAYHCLGDAQFRLKWFDEAVASYRRALELAQDDPIVLAKLGEALLAKARTDRGTPDDVLDALACLRLVAQKDPTDHRRWYRLGRAALLAGDYTMAESCFLRANAIAQDTAPSWPRGLVELGRVWFDQGRYEEAVAAYQEARGRDEGNGEAYFGLGREAYRQRKYADAEKAFRQALAAAPDHWEAWLYRGECCWQQGRAEPALHCFRRAAALHPRSPEAQQALIRALDGRGLHAETATAYLALGVATPEAVRHGAWTDNGTRVKAARAAILAGTGEGNDVAAPGEQRLFRWAALAWMQADLLLWAERLAADPSCDFLVVQKMKEWLADPVFDRTRDEAAVTTLPAADELPAWQTFWKQVEQLHALADRSSRRK